MNLNPIFGIRFALSYRMKRNVTLILATVFSMNMMFAQTATADQDGEPVSTTTTLPSVKHNAFKAGEILVYRLHYGFLDAGEAILEVQESDKKIAGRPIYRVVGKGSTINAFSWFYKVDDRYETYLDKQGVFPWLFIRRVNEGGHEISQDYTFVQNKQKVKTEKGKEFEVPMGVQDMLSSFYYARTIDFSGAKEGDIYEIESFMDEELFTLKIKYVGIETIKVRNGKYRCMKFHPVVQSGRIFKDEDDLVVWISDDENKIPILARADLLIGSIKMELTGAAGLANPLAKIK
jgi:hypothetical protein